MTRPRTKLVSFLVRLFTSSLDFPIAWANFSMLLPRCSRMHYHNHPCTLTQGHSFARQWPRANYSRSICQLNTRPSAAENLCAA